MNVFLEIYYLGWESNILRKGNFNVNRRKFAENADQAVADVAIQWIWQIIKEENICKILEVKYNRTVDITEIVTEKLDEVPEDELWWI